MNNYFDFYKNMIDTQKNMMDSFNAMMPKVPSGDAKEDMFNNYENWIKAQQQMFDFTKNMANGTMNWPVTNPMEAWEKMMDLYNPVKFGKNLGVDETKVFEKMLNANKFYLTMYNFYTELNDNYVTPTVDEMQRIIDEAMVNYEKMFRESLLPLMPEELRPFVENPFNFSRTVLDVTSTFVNPWKETYPEMMELWMQAPMSREKLTEYIKLWKENYDRTVGALVKSPVVGSNRELVEQQNRSVDAMIEMILTVSEYLGSIATISNENARKSMEEWMTLSKEDLEPKSFKEFYDYWTRKLESEIEVFFYTDEFANLMARTTDSIMRFKIETDKVMEKYLETTPIVTKGQIDSLYKTVYELKKEVKSLNKQIEVLEAEKKENKDVNKKKTK